MIRPASDGGAPVRGASSRIAVVLAAGRGTRMGAERNKALLPILDKPLVLYSVETMRQAADEVLVVASEADMRDMQELLEGIEVVPGGATRQGSEWCALQALRSRLGPEDVVAFHDGARPLVAATDVRAVFEGASLRGAAALVEASRQALLEIEPGPGGETLVRTAYEASDVWRALTPQAARMGWLVSAYEQAIAAGFDGTDTAAVLERAGYAVHLVAASSANPKVTVPDDIPAVEALMRQRKSSTTPPGSA